MTMRRRDRHNNRYIEEKRKRRDKLTGERKIGEN